MVVQPLTKSSSLRACDFFIGMPILLSTRTPYENPLSKYELSPRPERSEVESLPLSEVEWGPAVLYPSNQSPMEAPPFPLSSRAKPRDVRPSTSIESQWRRHSLYRDNNFPWALARYQNMNCHPSAERLHRLCACHAAGRRAVEEPVPSVAEGNPDDARLLMPALGAFQPPKPE